MQVLIDTSLLVEMERRGLGMESLVKDNSEYWICDAGVAEFLGGQPVKDAGKLKRFLDFWNSCIGKMASIPLDRECCERAGRLMAAARKRGKTVPLGDALHGAVADLQGLKVATLDTDHFKDLGIDNFNPLPPSAV